MLIHFLSTVKSGREGGNKKAAHAEPCAARNEPIWFAAGKVNRVTRIGAYSWVQPKKLPWKSLRTELIPVKGLFPQRAGQSRPRPDVSFPSFAQFWKQVGTFRGPEAATRSLWASHRMKWSWHLMPSPGLASLPQGECAGEVIGAGSMRSGAGREVQRCLCSPYKRKAALCPKYAGQSEQSRSLWKRAQPINEEEN